MSSFILRCFRQVLSTTQAVNRQKLTTNDQQDQALSIVDTSCDIIPRGPNGVPPVPEQSSDLVAKLQRTIQQTNDASVSVRKASLQALFDLFVVQWTETAVASSSNEEDLAEQAMDAGLGPAPVSVLPAGHLSACLEELSKPLLKRFGDSSEKCRELSVRLLSWLLRVCKNLTAVMPYMWPAVMRRLAPGHAYDQVMNMFGGPTPPSFIFCSHLLLLLQESCIFVHDIASHEAWKRGAATARQVCPWIRFMCRLDNLSTDVNALSPARQDMADRGSGGETSSHTVRGPTLLPAL
jgi:hypothetical protein